MKLTPLLLLVVICGSAVAFNPSLLSSCRRQQLRSVKNGHAIASSRKVLRRGVAFLAMQQQPGEYEYNDSAPAEPATTTSKRQQMMDAVMERQR